MGEFFSKTIVRWYENNKRDLPWRKTKNPYFIWLSEIILQQTRVEQGIPYYERFIREFPTVESLAKTSEQKVLILWQGLGYYSRARNLHHSAKKIWRDYRGVFPREPDQINSLKGIGDYTTAAIASFAFGIPLPVVDGNVQRLLARYFGITASPDSSAGKKEFVTLAGKLMPCQNPSDFNQAIMEFGSLQCKPVNPVCSVCPLAENCFALKNDRISEFPVKKKKKESLNRYFNYLYIRYKEFFYLQKRTSLDIWKNLFEFPLIESAKPLDKKSIKNSDGWKKIFGKQKVSFGNKVFSNKHILSHQNIYAKFYEINCLNQQTLENKNGWKKVRKSEMKKFPVSRLMEKFLDSMDGLKVNDF